MFSTNGRKVTPNLSPRDKAITIFKSYYDSRPVMHDPK
jgi:hypothetical protein